MSTKDPILYWCIDPLEHKIPLLELSQNFLAKWTQDKPYVIQPISIISDHESAQALYSGSQKAIGRALLDVSIQGLAPLKLLTTSEPPSRRNLIDEIKKEVKKEEPEGIILYTSNRGPLSKVILGSFSEAFLFDSELPILLFNTDQIKKTSVNLKKIVFATDFSHDSHLAFCRLLKKARALESSVQVLHKIDWATYHLSKYSPEELHSSEQVVKWKGTARNYNVEVHFEFEHDPLKNTANAVIEFAETCSAGMIALVDSSDAGGSYLLGSTTRQLATRSPLPLWVLRPEEGLEPHLSNKPEKK